MIALRGKPMDNLNRCKIQRFSSEKEALHGREKGDDDNLTWCKLQWPHFLPPFSYLGNKIETKCAPTLFQQGCR
jgi:hypothetical protein